MKGYTTQEIEQMINSIIVARRVAGDEVHDSLTQAIDLLQNIEGE